MKMMIRLITVAVSLTATVSVFAQTYGASSGASSAAYPATAPVASSNATVETSLVNLEDTLTSFDPFGSGSNASAVLVVPAGQMSVEAISAANEDMNVMARIFAGNLKQAGVTPTGKSAWSYSYNTGFNSFFGNPSVSDLEGTYLQGYGVLFTMKVGFPLAPGPDSNEPPKAAPKAGGDSVWQKTRQDMYEPQAARRKNTPEQEKYSAEKVENLKTAIITSLKHAANIRGLQPADSVVVTIISQSSRKTIVTMKKIEGTEDVVVVDSTNKTTVYKGGLPEDISQSAPTVLTIRAKVSDVTAFNKGETNLDQFRQKVQVLSHPYLGGRGGPTTTTSLAVPSASRRPAPTTVPAAQP
jgi:hypothetical protein